LVTKLIGDFDHRPGSWVPNHLFANQPIPVRNLVDVRAGAIIKLRTLLTPFFQCRLFGDDPVAEPRCAAGGRSSNIIISVRRERPSSIVCPASDSARKKQKTLPDVQGLDLAYVSSAAGPARPDGELRRNKTLPDVQRLDLAYVSSAAGPARPDGELKRSCDVGQHRPQHLLAGEARAIGRRLTGRH
jgi:hypothetical protein